jgi:hypothetical protein
VRARPAAKPKNVARQENAYRKSRVGRDFREILFACRGRRPLSNLSATARPDNSAFWVQEAKSAPTTEVPPAGPALAVCVALLDLGTHTEEVKDKSGVVKNKDFHKVYLLIFRTPRRGLAVTK